MAGVYASMFLRQCLTNAFDIKRLGSKDLQDWLAEIGIGFLKKKFTTSCLILGLFTQVILGLSLRWEGYYKVRTILGYYTILLRILL